MSFDDGSIGCLVAVLSLPEEMKSSQNGGDSKEGPGHFVSTRFFSPRIFYHSFAKDVSQNIPLKCREHCSCLCAMTH